MLVNLYSQYFELTLLQDIYFSSHSRAAAYLLRGTPPTSLILLVAKVYNIVVILNAIYWTD